MCFLANLRPFCNNYVAKVSVVKWAQNWICVDGNVFLAYPVILKLHWKWQLCKYLAMPEITHPATKIQFWDHIAIDTFVTLLFSGLRFTRNPSKSGILHILIHFLLNHFYVVYNFTAPEVKGLERKERQFWKWHGNSNKMGGCTSLGGDLVVL